jgi:hypothetical protein
MDNGATLSGKDQFIRNMREFSLFLQYPILGHMGTLINFITA